MRLTMLGTGSASVTDCYNTCFVIEDNGKYFMVDGGGGNLVVSQLKKSNISVNDIHHIFVTHKHLDHIVGVIWMIRFILQNMNTESYEGDAYIYGHDEVISVIDSLSHTLIRPKESDLIGKRLHLVTVEDNSVFDIINHEVTFFDINSTKTKQFGFKINIDDDKYLCCLGDEPFKEPARKHAMNSEWLLHEAFCLDSQADIFNPYEKHHSTVKNACETAAYLGIKNLVLYHTEDKNYSNRKKLYSEEGKKYFDGNLYIPDDLEVIEL